jgi:hypothetical protein
MDLVSSGELDSSRRQGVFGRAQRTWGTKTGPPSTGRMGNTYRLIIKV